MDDPVSGEVGGELISQRRYLSLDSGLISNPNPGRKRFGFVGGADYFERDSRDHGGGRLHAVADDHDFIELEAAGLGRSRGDLIDDVFEGGAVGDKSAELGHHVFIEMTRFD